MPRWRYLFDSFDRALQAWGELSLSLAIALVMVAVLIGDCLTFWLPDPRDS